jgi:hypothetical protein
MIDPQVHDTPVTPAEAHPEPHEAQPERKQASTPRRPRVVHHPAPLFPEHPEHQAPPTQRTQWKAIIRTLALEAVTERKNQIPLGLIILLSITTLALTLAARSAPPAPQLQEWFTHVVISSSQPGTSLFSNGRYLGEIGPAGREFAMVPGVIRLRVIHSRCRPSDTTFDFKAGENWTIGPLNAACGL